MKTIWLLAPALAALCACSSPVPDSAAGVGFGDYQAYLASMKAGDAAAVEAHAHASAIGGEPVQTAALPAAAPVSTSELASAGIGATSQQTAAVITPAAEPVVTPTATAAPIETSAWESEPPLNTVENLRDTAANAPAAAPAATGAALERPTDLGPNLAAFALATNHAVGQPVYGRVFPSRGRAQRTCSKYPSPDRAQIAFLSAGGPNRDLYGMDPDGDGFVCGWNPDTFRSVVSR